MVIAEIVRGRARLSELRADWDRLMGRGEYEPSVSFEWTAALLESHVQEEDEIVFVILKQDDAVIGIIPLVLRPLKRLGQTFIRAFPMCEFTYTHSDLLIEEASESALAAFVDALYRSELRWDVFSMTRLLEARPLGALLCKIVSQRGLRFRFEREQPSFFLTIEGSYEDYLKRRSGSFRNALKRIERKLMTRGLVEIRNLNAFANVDQAYEALLSIEQRSWKQEHGTSILSISRQTTFYRRLCTLAAEKQWLHLGFLHLDGRPIAYNLGLIVNNTYYYLKTSYASEERPLHPATFLRARLLEELIGQGVKRIDFPGELYEWERQWTEEMLGHRSLTLFASSVKGIVYSVYRKAKAFGHKDGSLLVRYVDPRSNKSRFP